MPHPVDIHTRDFRLLDDKQFFLWKDNKIGDRFLISDNFNFHLVTPSLSVARYKSDYTYKKS
jgi:hypothetical protein